MNIRSVLHILGWLSLLLGLLLLIPLAIALGYGGGWGGETWAFVGSFLISAALGFILKWRCKLDPDDFGVPEGFACVTLGWLLVTLLGALPFLFSGVCSGFVDAFFETMSGFTTTGATIIEDIEALPKGILFWRSFTHWLGGMGIVALSIAVLPMLGGGGNMLFRAEVPGPTTDKLHFWVAYYCLNWGSTAVSGSSGSCRRYQQPVLPFWLGSVITLPCCRV